MPDLMLEAPDGRRLAWKSDEWMAQRFDPSVPDPLSVVVPYLDRAPRWLVLGGLGNAADGQEALRRWPTARLVGVDFDPRAIAWQQAHGWPAEAPLLQVALSNHEGQEVAGIDDINCSSLHPFNVQAVPLNRRVIVSTTTLDRLDEQYGPFEDAILWLDLEDYDYKALRGATNLLQRRPPLVVGVEVRYHLETVSNPDMRALLSSFGYHHRLTWFRQWWGHNEVWQWQG